MRFSLKIAIGIVAFTTATGAADTQFQNTQSERSKEKIDSPSRLIEDRGQRLDSNAERSKPHVEGQLLVGLKIPERFGSANHFQLLTASVLRRLHSEIGSNVRTLATYSQSGWELVELPPGVSTKDAILQYTNAFSALKATLRAALALNSDEAQAVEAASLKVQEVGFIELLHPVNTGAPPPVRVEGDHSTDITGGPNDPLLKKQGRYENLHAADAWKITQGSRNIVVAIVDNGVGYNHPDLAGNMWSGHGYNSCTGGNDVPAGQHSTHVAGIIGEIGNNNLLGVGVNWNVTMVSVYLCGITLVSNPPPPGGEAPSVPELQHVPETQALSSYEWIIKQRNTHQLEIRVVNNSWIGDDSEAIKDNINAAGSAGILSVFAAGNQGLDIDQHPVYPAYFHLPSMVVVAASDSEHGDAVADFSNWGQQHVDVAAPGVNVYSTCPQNTSGCGVYDPGMMTMSGTSMATPSVAGAAALLLSLNDQLTPEQIRQHIIDSVDKMDQWRDRVVSGGRINLAKLLQSVGSPIPPPTVPPSDGDIYRYSGGVFVKKGLFWVEFQNQETQPSNTFEEVYRGDKFIAIFDPSRGLVVRFPMQGGLATWTTFDRDSWVPLYNVTH